MNEILQEVKIAKVYKKMERNKDTRRIFGNNTNIVRIKKESIGFVSKIGIKNMCAKQIKQKTVKKRMKLLKMRH